MLMIWGFLTLFIIPPLGLLLILLGIAVEVKVRVNNAREVSFAKREVRDYYRERMAKVKS